MDPAPRPRLVVTGGSGLLGGAVVAAAGPFFEVVATRLARRPAAALERLARWAVLDVRDAPAVRALCTAERPAVVLHAAIAIGADTLGPVTVDGSAHVAAAARECGAALIHVSTDMVFDGEHGPFAEDAPPSPITDYGRAKAAAEVAARAAHPDCVVARLPLLYRLQPPDRALGAWLTEARAGRGYPLFRDEIRCPAHVDDVAAALVLVARALAGDASLPPPPPVVHLAGPRALSRLEFGQLVLDALGLPRSLATPGLSTDAAVRRPRELVLTARLTPRAFTAPLRAPEAALPGAGTA